MNIRTSLTPLLILIVLAGVSVPSAFATSYLVRLDGTGDYTSIQPAINACSDGDTVLVDDGTYIGANNRNLDFGGTELVLRSVNGPANCIIDCAFAGRGVYFYQNQGSTSVLQGFTIRNGSASEGAGVYIQGGDATGCATILDNIFFNNHATGSGGAIYVTSTYTPTIHNNWFQSNSAVNGGAIRTQTGLDLMNNMFLANGASGDGGAIAATMNGTTIASYNCNFVGNNAASEGGALWCNDAAVCYSWNSIFWGNNAATGPTGYGGPTPGGGIMYFNYCVVNDQASATVGLTFWGDGMSEDDPLFVSGPGGAYYLSQTAAGQGADSPCLDAGSTYATAIRMYIVGSDYTNRRSMIRMTSRTDEVNDTGQVDIGYHYTTTLPVDIRVPADCPTIQCAISEAYDGESVLVDDGTYNEAIDFEGKAISVEDATPGGTKPTLWCEGLGESGVRFDSGEGSDSVLDGFLITRATTSTGAGIYIFDADPVIRNCEIRSNFATGSGGGLFCAGGSTALLEGNLFHQNAAGTDGGGIYVVHSSPTIVNNEFFANNAADGGAIHVYGSGSPLILDNLIHHNIGARGSAVFSDEAGFIIESCTIAHNQGSGLHAIDAADLTVVNCIVAFGTSGAAAEVETGGTATLTCSDVYANAGGDWTGALAGQLGTGGNFLANPGFCNTASFDYTLYDVSPCLAANSPGCGQVGALGQGCIYSNTTYVVDPGGGGDFDTIQAAVDAAFDGDVVSLVDATYTGAGNRDVTTRGKAVTVASQSGNPAACVMNCQGSVSEPHRGFLINSGEGATTVISGLRITGAHTTTGAGIYISGTSPLIVNCTFDTITGQDGGGIFVGGSGNPTIRQCEFRDIDVTNAGGGVCVSYAAATIHDCLFVDNYARWGGAGVYLLDSLGNVSDSIFTGNDCDAWGGGIHVTRAGNYTLTERCTFDGNGAPQGGHVYARDDGTIDLDNCILTSSFEGSAAYASDGGTVTATCSDVWNNLGGDWVDGIAGQDVNPGNLSVDPLYCDAATGDFTIQDNSPCAAANNPLCGQIGAEGVGCGSGARIWTVEYDGSGDYPTIQAAIDAASPGDTVLLGSGTFRGDGNRDLTYRGKVVTVRGQASGAPSIIDCEGSSGDEHRGFYFGTGEGAGSVLAHVTVTGGYAWDGGGLHATAGVTPIIHDCVFTANTSTDDGGGVFLSHGCGPTLLRCEISSNSAVNRGGGLYAHDSVADLDSCIVAGNDAANYGGGIYTHETGSVDLQDCRIADNTGAAGGGVFIQGPATSSLLRVGFERNVATGAGGGFYERDGAITTFDFCTFYENEADLGGGVYNVFSCEPVFTNCTFASNTATTRGGALRIYTGADVTMTNCLLWGDDAGLGAEIAAASTCTLTVYCSDVQGGQDGVEDYAQTTVFDWDDRNLDDYPYFCEAVAGDLELVSGISPCLPAGNSCGVLMGAHGSGCAAPSAADEVIVPPAVTGLDPACPNPFNPRTRIGYSLERSGRATLAIFDVRGRRIRVLVDETRPAGTHVAVWNGRDEQGRAVGAGVYFFQLETLGQRLTGKVTLLK